MVAIAGCSGDTELGESGTETTSGGGSGGDGGTTTTTETETATPSPTESNSDTETTTTGSEPTTTGTETTGSEGDSGEEGVEVADGLELLKHELYVENEFSAGVEGEVENTSGSELGYVAVEVEFQDSDGTRIGEGLANTTDLPDGEVWAFDTLYTGSDDADAIDNYTIAVSDSPF